jgi:phenylalanine-4-hydroxylase
LRHSVTSPQPQRIALDLQRCMRTRYKIDDYQATYFVINSFDQLFELTAPDFTPLYGAVRAAGELSADASIASDSRITLA